MTAASSTTPFPFALVAEDRWGNETVPAVGGLEPRLAVSVVVPTESDRLRAALAAQSYPGELLDVVGPDVTHARGDIVVFLDPAVEPSPTLIEAHARWHHVLGDAVVTGPVGDQHASASNMSMRRETYAVLARDPDIEVVAELAYRAHTAALPLILDPSARAAGRPESVDAERLATRVPALRASAPGRSYPVPRAVVRIDGGHRPVAELIRVVEAVLASSLHDLFVCLDVAPDHPDRQLIESTFADDPRVIAGAGVDDFVLVPHAPVRIGLSPTALVTLETIERLVAATPEDDEELRCALTSGATVRAVATRALMKARRGEQGVRARHVPAGQIAIMPLDMSVPWPVPVPSGAWDRLQAELEAFEARVTTAEQRAQRLEATLAKLRRRRVVRLLARDPSHG